MLEVSSFWRKLSVGLKALRDLGPKSVALYAWYQVLIRVTALVRVRPSEPGAAALKPLLVLPERDKISSIIGEDGRQRLLSDAEEIVSGRVRLFGGDPRPLKLTVGGGLEPWYSRRVVEQVNQPAQLNEHDPSNAVDQPDPLPGSETCLQPDDVKFTWEPARFGWAYTLGRAYWLSGDERYPAAFWAYTEEFLRANPPQMGPHWESSQEVALRLMAFVFAAQVFGLSPHTTPQRAALLAQAVADCANRIPPTLVYARAQNNNHLLTEAAGLYTAALALPSARQAASWRKSGWKWFIRGLTGQISIDGAYTQQSTNYQRLMLQISLWMASLAGPAGDTFPPMVCQRLTAATRWLLALVEPQGGRVPNLGPNDGAYIFPLSVCAFDDYRPVLQASAQAFFPGSALMPATVFPPGEWDEMACWLSVEPGKCLQAPSAAATSSTRLTGAALLPAAPHTLGDKKTSWAYVRAVHFDARPGHADQLHMDLWWNGRNMAGDPGSYLYNAESPWENALAGSAVHNTVTLDGQDQMTRAGSFLWLDWAQAQVISYGKASDGSFERLVLHHNGYRRLGVTHQRAVEWQTGSWLVTDDLLPSDDRGGMRKVVTARLHWLLPDWDWQVSQEEYEQGMVLDLAAPPGKVRLILRGKIPASGEVGLKLQLVRAGERLYGEGAVLPQLGWYSPTYGVKIPRLSLVAVLENRPPFGFVTRWQFPAEKKK